MNTDSLPQIPIDLFNDWLRHAADKTIREFNAMVVSTVGNEGKPSSRIVLLKEISPEGCLIFFTNYDSRKGEEVAVNPNVSVNFFWAALERQIRIEGVIQKVAKEKSEAYFNSRPLESRVSAFLSPQSRVIVNLEKLRQESHGLIKNPDSVRLPENWGGYEIVPNYFEFWQGGRHRLHDRIRYRLKDGNWLIDRLAP